MLPIDPKERKGYPIGTGVLDYFPLALAAIAEASKHGNEQHHPGSALHWDRSKSTDQADCLIRHFIERGKFDTDGIRHTAKMAWRALALLQEEIEKEMKGQQHRDWQPSPRAEFYADAERAVIDGERDY